MIQGMAGLMSITGQPDGMPGAEPMKVGVAFADVFTGLYAAIGMLGALYHRERTGEGQYIDVALLDSQVAVLANQALNYLVGHKAPTRLGNAHPNIVPYQTFATKDGFIIIAVGTDRQFKEYCAIAGVPQLAEEERFKTNQPVRAARTHSPAGRTHEMADDSRWMRSRSTAVPGPINTIDRCS
jgi:crotonobetainyl-CoA:carnitine CoA-transferase CaiB-like acyl-CoA transferase